MLAPSLLDCSPSHPSKPLAMLRNNQSSWALGLGMIAWICLLFSPLAFQGVQADEVSDYGTVIGIVS